MYFYVIGCIQSRDDTINSTHVKITDRQYQIMRFGVSQRDWLLVGVGYDSFALQRIVLQNNLHIFNLSDICFVADNFVYLVK